MTVGWYAMHFEQKHIDMPQGLICQIRAELTNIYHSVTSTLYLVVLEECIRYFTESSTAPVTIVWGARVWNISGIHKHNHVHRPLYKASCNLEWPLIDHLSGIYRRRISWMAVNGGGAFTDKYVLMISLCLATRARIALCTWWIDV